MFWRCVSLASAFTQHVCHGAHSDDLPSWCCNPGDVVWVQLSHSLHETLFGPLFSPSFGVELRVTVVQLVLDASVLSCNCCQPIGPGAEWMFDTDKKGWKLLPWMLSIMAARAEKCGMYADGKDDQSREERRSCERSLAKILFNSEALKNSGSWAGTKALNSSEIPLLAARTAEFKLAQSGYRLSVLAFFSWYDWNYSWKWLL